MRFTEVLACFGMLTADIGCAEPAPRPPGRDLSCSGQSGCDLAPPAAGQADAGAGDSAPPSDPPVEFRVMQADTFVGGAYYAYQGKVVVDSLTGSGATQVSTDDGSDFLTDVPTGSEVWISVLPEDPDNCVDCLTTLQAIDTVNLRTTLLPPRLNPDAIIPVYLAKSSVLDGIFASMLAALYRDISLAQLVLFVDDTSGNPAQNVTFAASAAEGVIYLTRNGWSNALDATTGIAGLGVLVNLGGEALAAGQVSVEYVQSSGISSRATFRITKGAVTLGRIVLP